MNFKKLRLFAFCGMFGNLFAQPSDSLVRYSDLVFASAYEKQVFNSFLKNSKQTELLPLFLSGNEKATADLQKTTAQIISELVQDLKPKVAAAKTSPKAIKLIYSTVHERLLKKYELENHFSDIFSDGNYNCVSASALYGLVLQGLEIPFTIKETPSHVYLLAYPQTEKIVIETTDPIGGSMQLNEEFRNNYLNRLVRAKMISKAEFEEKPKNELFNKYFFRQEDDIDLRKLAGLQYYNVGIYTFEKKPEEAYRNFAKAYLLYPSTRIAFLIENALRNVLQKAEYEKWEDVEFYTKLARFNHDTTETIPRKQLVGEFGKITQNQLIDKSDAKLYDKSYQFIKQQVKDTTLLKDIEFIYNYETARFLLNAGKTEGVEEKLDIIYRIKPQNADVQNLIKGSLVKKITKQPNAKALLAALLPDIKKYPFLADDVTANTLLAFCYLDIAGQFYSQSNISKGDENRLAFEKVAKEKSLEMEGNQVAKCYLEASSAYFRAGNYAKSKQIVQKALEFAPGNFLLENRLSQMR